jgi:hypothetical protein
MRQALLEMLRYASVKLKDRLRCFKERVSGERNATDLKDEHVEQSHSVTRNDSLLRDS